MKSKLTTVGLAVLFALFVLLGVTNIARTQHKVKLQDIQLKSKQSDLLQLETKFQLLNRELEKKNLDEKKVQELEQQKQDLQKQLEDAQKALQAKVEQKRQEQEKVAQAARTPLAPQKVYAATGDIEAMVRAAAIKYGVNPDYLARIARCESTFNPNSVNRNYYENGHPSGLFQHISGYWPGRAAKYGWAGASVFDAQAQAEVTAQMFRDGHSNLWECK